MKKSFYIFVIFLLAITFLFQKISIKPTIVHAAACVASTYNQCGTGGCTPKATDLYSVTRSCTAAGAANYSCKDLGPSSQCGGGTVVKAPVVAVCSNGHKVGDTYNQCGGTCNGTTANAQQTVNVTVTAGCNYKCNPPAYINKSCGYTAPVAACSVANTYTECTNSASYCSNGGKIIGHTMLVTQYNSCPATPYKCVDQNKACIPSGGSGTTTGGNVACTYSQAGPNGTTQCFSGTGPNAGFNNGCKFDAKVGVKQVTCPGTKTATPGTVVCGTTSSSRCYQNSCTNPKLPVAEGAINTGTCGSTYPNTGVCCKPCPAGQSCTTSAKAVCGNGVCDAGETAASCPADCGTSASACGNGVCDAGETAASCPADCGTSAPACGNSVCDAGETAASCPADCGTSASACGNGVCDAGETAASCPADCNSAIGNACGGTNSGGTCMSGPDLITVKLAGYVCGNYGAGACSPNGYCCAPTTTTACKANSGSCQSTTNCLASINTPGVNDCSQTPTKQVCCSDVGTPTSLTFISSKTGENLLAKVLAAQSIIINGTVGYDVNTQTFSNPAYPISNISAGQYDVYMHVDGYLDKHITDTTGSTLFNISNSQSTLAIPATKLVKGDVVPAPHGDNVIDIQDYTAVISCLGQTNPSATCPDPKKVDFNKDGVINVVDVDILLAHFNEHGDVPILTNADTNSNNANPGPTQTPIFTCVTDPSCANNGKGGVQMCPLKCTMK